MKKFQICFCLIMFTALLAVSFSGCLNNDSNSGPQINMSGSDTATFSGEITNISTDGENIFVTVLTEYESYYGRSQMNFILDNTTRHNLYLTGEYGTTSVGDFVFIGYSLSEYEKSPDSVTAENAHVFTDGMTLYSGVVEEIRPLENDSNRGVILLNHSQNSLGLSLTAFSYSQSTHFTTNVKEGMMISIYGDSLMLESYPTQCQAYEV